MLMRDRRGRAPEGFWTYTVLVFSLGCILGTALCSGMWIESGRFQTTKVGTYALKCANDEAIAP